MMIKFRIQIQTLKKSVTQEPNNLENTKCILSTKNEINIRIKAVNARNALHGPHN
jgi:hypothetical protein